MSGTQGLPLSRIVKATTSLSPGGVSLRNFGVGLILGPSTTLPLVQRLAGYDDIDEVNAVYPLGSPEQLAAQTYFSASVTPSKLYIGRWNATASAARLYGGYALQGGVASSGAFLVALQGITAGAFSINIDGTVYQITGVNLSSAVTLQQAATLLQTAIGHAVTVKWDSVNLRFVIQSGTTTNTSNVGFAAAPATGTDISGTLNLTAARGAFVDPYAAAESFAAAVVAVEAASGDWYGLIPADAATPLLQVADYLAAAAAVEAFATTRIMLVTSQMAAEISAVNTSSTGYALKNGEFSRSIVQYSSQSPYALASISGLMSTVDFNGNNTTLNYKFKSEPGITAETLSSAQADAAEANNVNLFVNYANSTPIFEQGTMANGDYLDERQGLDWLANYVQAAMVNELIAQPKLAQTDQGMQVLETVADAAMEQGVTNGLLAGGVWTGPNIGTLKTGDTLPSGYYTYAPPMASQSAAVRKTRAAPAMQIACCLAGAINSASALITVVR